MVARAPDRVFAAIMRVNGAEAAALYKCIQRIVVNEDLEQGSSFDVTIALCRNADGSWPHLDDEHLRPWNRVTIIAGFPTHADTIMDGYITHVHPVADRAAASVTVSVRGVDASYKMNLEEKCKVWREQSYEAIAKQIFGDYKFTPTVAEEAAGQSGAQLPSVVQRGTDHRFLRELARRKGFEFFVRGAEAHFHPPDLSGTPQKLIAVDFGEETNCDQLDVIVDGTRPTEAVMSRIDPLTGQAETVTATASDLPALGATDLRELRGHGVPQTVVKVRRQGAVNRAQMEDAVGGVLRRQGWWVTATGRLNGLRYGRVLRSRKTVTIKGLGPTYNGVYYVRKVTHTLASRSYVMQFEAVRNRIGQTGTEDFTGERPDAGAIPAAAGMGADSDVVTVAAAGAEVLPA